MIEHLAIAFFIIIFIILITRIINLVLEIKEHNEKLEKQLLEFIKKLSKND